MSNISSLAINQKLVSNVSSVYVSNNGLVFVM